MPLYPPAVTPAGADTYVQYNNAGAFGAEAGFTYNQSTDLMIAPKINVVETVGNSNSTPFKVYNPALSSGDNLRGLQFSLNTVGRPELEGIQADGGVNNLFEFRGRSGAGGTIVISAEQTLWSNNSPIYVLGNIVGASVPMVNMTTGDLAELGPNYSTLSTTWRTFPLKVYYGQNTSAGTANGGYGAFVRKNDGGGESEVGRWAGTGRFGVATTAPDKQVEINSTTGDTLRLTYNDSNGSATNYVDLLVSSSGDLTITPSGGDTAFTGSIQVDSIVNDTGLAAGTYTPTITNTTNIDSSTAYACQYLRVGNTVTVSGKVLINVNTDGIATEAGISLPIASNFGAVEDCGGASGANREMTIGPIIYADTTNDRVRFDFTPFGLGNHNFFFTFTYRVI